MKPTPSASFPLRSPYIRRAAITGGRRSSRPFPEPKRRWGPTSTQPRNTDGSWCSPSPPPQPREERRRPKIGAILAARCSKPAKKAPSTECSFRSTGPWSPKTRTTPRETFCGVCGRRLGPEVPIAISLDLHANVSDAMARLANIVIAYRTYPHIDQYERGMEAADLLQRAMNGEIRPRSLVWRAPVLEGLDYGRTQGGPMSRILARADQLRRKNPGVSDHYRLRGICLGGHPRCRTFRHPHGKRGCLPVPGYCRRINKRGLGNEARNHGPPLQPAGSHGRGREGIKRWQAAHPGGFHRQSRVGGIRGFGSAAGGHDPGRIWKTPPLAASPTRKPPRNASLPEWGKR